MSRSRFVLLFFAFAYVSPSWPASHQSCYSNADFRDEIDISNFIHKTADYYEGSRRQKVESMTAQEQDRYAATGSLKCLGMNGTAQLTVTNDMITGPGHILNDPTNCKALAKPTDCKFSVRSHGKTIEVPIAELVGTGFKCPTPSNRPLPLKSYRDWAVFRLQFPIDDVKPYPIDEQKVANMRRDDRAVMIGHSVDFHARLINNKWVMPKHYGTCRIDHVDSTYEPYFFSAPCGCGEGCSGGAIMTDDARPSLLGIMAGNIESGAELDHAIKTGTPNVFHADPDKRDSYFIPFTGEFLKIVKDAAR